MTCAGAELFTGCPNREGNDLSALSILTAAACSGHAPQPKDQEEGMRSGLPAKDINPSGTRPALRQNREEKQIRETETKQRGDREI